MAHHYKYYQKLEKIKKGLPLLIGSAIHEVLEEFTEGRDPNVPMAKFRKDFDKLFNEEKAELGDLPTELENIMVSYFKFYENDGLTYPVRHRGLMSEFPVIVDLDNETQFVGYVDKIPQDPEGRNWVMDHKSCKSIPQESSRFADYQLLIYHWLLPQLGYPKPDGVIWDYIRKKAPTVPELLKAGGLSRAKSIDTTYDVYMATVDRLLGPEARPEYEEFAQTLKGREEKFFRRIYLPHPNSSMVDTVVGDLMTSIKEIREKGPTATTRSMTKDCSWCSYYNLCQAELRGLDSDFIRKAEYKIKGEEDGNQEEVLVTEDDAD
jgi:RecB family exonuclease